MNTWRSAFVGKSSSVWAEYDGRCIFCRKFVMVQVWVGDERHLTPFFGCYDCDKVFVPATIFMEVKAATHEGYESTVTSHSPSTATSHGD